MALFRCGASAVQIPDLTLTVFGSSSPQAEISKDVADLYTTFETPDSNVKLLLDGHDASVTLTANTPYNVSDYTFTNRIGAIKAGSSAEFKLIFKA